MNLTVDQYFEWQKTGRFPTESAAAGTREGPASLAAVPFAATGRPAVAHRFAGLAKGDVRTRGRMNKTEILWAAELEAQRLAGHVYAWWFEPFRLRVTDPAPRERAVYFTPDFLVQLTNGGIFVDDVKGGAVNDASIVRLKTAASKFTLWTFRIVKRVKGSWEIRTL